MISGLIFGLIGSIIASIRFKALLKQCLIVDNNTDIELFEHKGKTYDRKKFIELQADRLKSVSQRELKKQLEQYESGLVKSKTPDIDMAIIEAYKSVIQ